MNRPSPSRNPRSRLSHQHIRALVDGHDVFGDSFGRGEDAPDAMLDAWSDPATRAEAFALLRDIEARRTGVQAMPGLWWIARGERRPPYERHRAAEIARLREIADELTPDEREHLRLLDIDLNAPAARVGRTS